MTCDSLHRRLHPASQLSPTETFNHAGLCLLSCKMGGGSGPEAQLSHRKLHVKSVPRWCCHCPAVSRTGDGGREGRPPTRPGDPAAHRPLCGEHSEEAAPLHPRKMTLQEDTSQGHADPQSGSVRSLRQQGLLKNAGGSSTPHTGTLCGGQRTLWGPRANSKAVCPDSAKMPLLLSPQALEAGDLLPPGGSRRKARNRLTGERL